MKSLKALILVAALCALAARTSATCGKKGQPCCGGNCYAGMFCDSYSGYTCQYNCGLIGQPCCPSGWVNTTANLFCQDASGADPKRAIENCGAVGQKCCRNLYCQSTPSTTKVYCDSNLICRSNTGQGPNNCGNLGMSCCTGTNKCMAGYECDTSLSKCVVYCGTIGQPCCKTGSGSTYCKSGSGTYCEVTGYCVNNCGTSKGQQCCPTGYCKSTCLSTAFCS